MDAQPVKNVIVGGGSAGYTIPMLTIYPTHNPANRKKKPLYPGVGEATILGFHYSRVRNTTELWTKGDATKLGTYFS